MGYLKSHKTTIMSSNCYENFDSKYGNNDTELKNCSVVVFKRSNFSNFFGNFLLTILLILGIFSKVLS